MLKFVTAFSAAVIVAFALVGSATTASAGGYHRGGGGYGGCCGPIPPKYTTSTRTVHKYIKHHRDVWRVKHFKRYKLKVHTTRIQPVYHVHTVIRHHTKLVGVIVPIHKKRTVWLHPRTIRTSSHVYLRPQCACGGGGYGGY
jgi:hypothetical protein